MADESRIDKSMTGVEIKQFLEMQHVFEKLLEKAVESYVERSMFSGWSMTSRYFSAEDDTVMVELGKPDSKAEWIGIPISEIERTGYSEEWKPPKPKMPPCMIIKEDDGRPKCPKCESTQVRGSWGLGRVLGCIQPECERYYSGR